MFQKAFSKREKALLIVLVLILIGALYVFTVHMPVTEGIETAQALIEDADMNIQIKLTRVQRMTAMSAEIQQMKDSGDMQELPTYDYLPKEIAFLNSILGDATDFQLNFDTQFPKDGEEDILRRTAKISFVAKSYASAKQAISKLESSTFMDKIKDLSITPAERDSYDIMSGPVKVALSITFFERME